MHLIPPYPAVRVITNHKKKKEKDAPLSQETAKGPFSAQSFSFVMNEEQQRSRSIVKSKSPVFSGVRKNPPLVPMYPEGTTLFP
ncbi:hypothetical protein CEXT_555261 [Caerostris extrusa]|uniref:Uncharacterized protein n=1 Tax=Caerostris extrusa TaxID=172846 RepID=A0AAV4N7S1_CAEEX|nr:hypothetical protein CEXT_555261 [Caerostris extrusa]